MACILKQVIHMATNSNKLIIFFSLIILFPFYSCQYSAKSSHRLFNETSGHTFDVIIVPGIPFHPSEWDLTMKGRVYWSKFLYDKGIAKNIMFSGSSVYTPYTEAEIMALYAEALGIPKEHIYIETKAEHSTENVYYSYKKAKKLGFRKIAVASDPFQTRMLKRFTKRRVDPEVKLIPFVIDSLKQIEPQMVTPSIDYSRAFNSAFVPITERESLWKRIKGTLGHNLDTKAYD
jgi:uncharacterized SAM-binding protein YcdF (DUF218 family)